MGVSGANIGEIILHKGNNEYNVSQTGTRLTCLWNSKDSVATKERVKRERFRK